MANRAFLMLTDKTTQKRRMISQWNYCVPLMHYLLMGFETEVIQPNTSPHSVEIQADWKKGRAFGLSFLEWFGARSPEWSEQCNELSRVLEGLSTNSLVTLNAQETYAAQAKSFGDQALEDVEIANAAVQGISALMSNHQETDVSDTHWIIEDSFGDVPLWMGIDPLAW